MHWFHSFFRKKVSLLCALISLNSRAICKLGSASLHLAVFQLKLLKMGKSFPGVRKLEDKKEDKSKIGLRYQHLIKRPEQDSSSYRASWLQYANNIWSVTNSGDLLLVGEALLVFWASAFWEWLSQTTGAVKI